MGGRKPIQEYAKDRLLRDRDGSSNEDFASQETDVAGELEAAAAYFFARDRSPQRVVQAIGILTKALARSGKDQDLPVRPGTVPGGDELQG